MLAIFWQHLASSCSTLGVCPEPARASAQKHPGRLSGRGPLYGRDCLGQLSRSYWRRAIYICLGASLSGKNASVRERLSRASVRERPWRLSGSGWGRLSGSGRGQCPGASGPSFLGRLRHLPGMSGREASRASVRRRLGRLSGSVPGVCPEAAGDSVPERLGRLSGGVWGVCPREFVREPVR